MCMSGPRPQAPPPPPIQIAVEKLVAKTAEDIKPAKSKAKKRQNRDRFNLNKRSTKISRIGGINPNITSKALKIGNK